MMQAVGDFVSGFNYIPVYTEATGSYQVITGLWQKQAASLQKSMFGHSHPRYFTIKAMKKEGEENFQEGIEKLTNSAVVIGIFVLTFYF